MLEYYYRSLTQYKLAGYLLNTSMVKPILKKVWKPSLLLLSTLNRFLNDNGEQHSLKVTQASRKGETANLWAGG